MKNLLPLFLRSTMEKIKEMLNRYDCELIGSRIKHKSGKYLQFSVDEITMNKNKPFQAFEDRLFELLEEAIKQKVGEMKDG